jgi:hypothetical protein
MRRTNELPTAEELNRVLRYVPESGKLLWLVGRLKGQEAGSCQFSYGGAFFTHQITVFGSRLATARVVWKMVTGQDPAGAVIHKNFNRADLRWENLALKGSGDSVWRNHRPVRTESGFLGVYRKGRNWMARVRGADSKLHYLGTFPSQDDAAEAVAAYDRRFRLQARKGE